MKRSLAALSATAMLCCATAAQAQTTNVEGVPQFGNVFVIIGENTDLSQLDKNNSPTCLERSSPSRPG
jgi:hypothetical protein